MSDRLSHSVHLVVDAHVHVTGLILQSALFPSSKAHSPLIDRNKEQTRLRIICRWEPICATFKSRDNRLDSCTAGFWFHLLIDNGLACLGVETFRPIDTLHHGKCINALSIGAIDRIKIAVAI